MRWDPFLLLNIPRSHICLKFTKNLPKFQFIWSDLWNNNLWEKVVFDGFCLFLSLKYANFLFFIKKKTVLGLSLGFEIDDVGFSNKFEFWRMWVFILGVLGHRNFQFENTVYTIRELFCFSLFISFSEFYRFCWSFILFSSSLWCFDLWFPFCTSCFCLFGELVVFYEIHFLPRFKIFVWILFSSFSPEPIWNLVLFWSPFLVFLINFFVP